MFRYKTSKQAFIIAALVILLCLICLVGATLALFTNDPEYGTIGIITTSGDIGIEIVDTAGESLMGKSLTFVSSSGNPNILFEPGSTFSTQGFKVKNTGNIHIDIKLSVAKDNVVDINQQPVDIKEFEEAFEVKIVEQKPNEAVDYSKAVELPLFEENINAGDCSDSTYYLVVKMKETAGHKFQDQSYSGIGVTVCAVQGNGTFD